jgi:hypothetical protein
MNILLKSFEFGRPFEEEILFVETVWCPRQSLDSLVLLSATCIGNDGKSCPLLHGSLAPMLFSRKLTFTDHQSSYCGWDIILAGNVIPRMQALLIHSDNITWATELFFSRYTEDLSFNLKMMQILSQKRYFSASVKKVTLQFQLFQREDFREFLANCCNRVEEFEWDDAIIEWDAIKIPFRDEDLEFLSGFTSLTCLNVGDGYDGSVLHHLTKLPRLKTLELGCPRQGQYAAIKMISSLKSLRSLDLNDFCNATEDGWRHLSHLFSLERIFVILAAFDFTGELSKIENLKSIHLISCEITDESLHNLAKLPQLHELIIETCPNITKDGLNHLLESPCLCANKVYFDQESVPREDLVEFWKKLTQRQQEKLEKASGARRERQ